MQSSLNLHGKPNSWKMHRALKLCRNAGHRIRLYCMKPAPSHYMPTVPAILQRKLLEDFQNALEGSTTSRAPLLCWSSVKSYESPQREALTLPCPVWAVEVVKVSQWRQSRSWGLSAKDFSRLRPWEHFPEENLQKRLRQTSHTPNLVDQK